MSNNRNHVGISLSDDFIYTLNSLKSIHNCSTSDLIRILLKREAELYNLPKHNSLVVKPSIGRPPKNNNKDNPQNTQQQQQE